MMYLHPYMVWGGFRYLKRIDPEHFNDNTSPIHFNKTIDFILNVYNDKFSAEVNKTKSNTKLTKKNSLKENSVERITQTIEDLKKLISDERIDDLDRMMYQQMYKEEQDKLLEVTENSMLSLAEASNDTDDDLVVTQRKEYNEYLRKQFHKYIKYCEEEMDVAKDLKTSYHNEYFEKEKDKINWATVTPKLGNAYQIFRYFDLMRWWKEFGSLQFPEIAVVASIVLSKPTHNGFQERVFSRGTYFDNKLRQRISEKSFEMQVLNSLNSDIVNDIQKKLNVELEKDDEGYKKYVMDFYSREDGTADIVTINDVCGKANSDDESIQTVESEESCCNSSISSNDTDDDVGSMNEEK